MAPDVRAANQRFSDGVSNAAAQAKPRFAHDRES